MRSDEIDEFMNDYGRDAANAINLLVLLLWYVLRVKCNFLNIFYSISCIILATVRC